MKLILKSVTAAILAGGVIFAAMPASAQAPPMREAAPQRDGARMPMGQAMPGMMMRPMARMMIEASMHQRAIGARFAMERIMRSFAERVQAMDENEDGAVSEDEFIAGMMETFARLDTNDDGVLDENDRPESGERMRTRMEDEPEAGPQRDRRAVPDADMQRFQGEGRPVWPGGMFHHH